MAKQIIQNPVVILNSGTISANVAQATINLTADDIEVTNFTSTARERIGGLKDGTFSMDVHQDYAASAIDSIVFPLVGGTAAIKVRPGGTAAIGTANPEYQFNVLVTEYNPIDSAVGDLATFSVSWPITGAVARATA
jgi:hypothetical protein